MRRKAPVRKNTKTMLITEAHFKALQRAFLTSHFDANETYFLERQLTQLRAKIFEIDFPPPLSRQFVPKATDIAPSATTFAYQVYEPVGAATFINYKSTDIPRVDTVTREVLGKVIPIGAAYGWDINELREAARLNVQLSDMKLKAARDLIERGIDKCVALGTIADETGALPDVGLTGLVNNPLVVTAGILAGHWWFAGTPPTPDVILADLTALIGSIQNLSKNVYHADTLLLPTAHYSYAEQVPFSALTGESILTVLKRNNPGLTLVAPWYLLDTAGAAGVPRAIAYQRDSMVLESIIPQEFEVLPPEMHGFEVINNCHARCGGTRIYRILGIKYQDYPTS